MSNTSGIPTQAHGGRLGEAGVPWRQFISNKGWVGEAVLDSLGATTSAVIKVDVPWAKRAVAMKAILGYSEASGTAIKRTLPMRCPDTALEHMYASRITGYEGIVPRKDTNGLSWTKGAEGDFQSYKICRMTIAFAPPTFELIKDGSFGPNDEWRRYTTLQMRPAAEFIAREGQLKIPAVYLGAANALTVTGKVGIIKTKANITVTWWQVPLRGLYNDAGRASKIIRA